MHPWARARAHTHTHTHKTSYVADKMFKISRRHVHIVYLNIAYGLHGDVVNSSNHNMYIRSSIVQNLQMFWSSVH
jgi:hypothetical protein